MRKIALVTVLFLFAFTVRAEDRQFVPSCTIQVAAIQDHYSIGNRL